jgi:hypothetical protein
MKPDLDVVAVEEIRGLMPPENSVRGGLSGSISDILILIKSSSRGAAASFGTARTLGRWKV